MNSGTLVASLIMAALLAVLIAFVIQLMMRGWRERARRQAEMIGTLPPVPETVGIADRRADSRHVRRLHACA